MNVSQGLGIINASNAKQELPKWVLCSRVAPVGSSFAALPTFLPFAWVESTNTEGFYLTKEICGHRNIHSIILLGTLK